MPFRRGKKRKGIQPGVPYETQRNVSYQDVCNAGFAGPGLSQEQIARMRHFKPVSFVEPTPVLTDLGMQVRKYNYPDWEKSNPPADYHVRGVDAFARLMEVTGQWPKGGT
jgi:hypothetical protein